MVETRRCCGAGMAGVTLFFLRSSAGSVSRRSQVSSKSHLLVAVPSAGRDLLLGDGVAGDTAWACLGECSSLYLILPFYVSISTTTTTNGRTSPDSRSGVLCLDRTACRFLRRTKPGRTQRKLSQNSLCLHGHCVHVCRAHALFPAPGFGFHSAADVGGGRRVFALVADGLGVRRVRRNRASGRVVGGIMGIGVGSWPRKGG